MTQKNEKLPMDLDEFVGGMHGLLEAFKKDYLEKNLKDQDKYPFKLEHENAGLWFEMFMDFSAYGGEVE